MHVREIPHMIFDRLVSEEGRRIVNPRELARIAFPGKDEDEIRELCAGEREVAELGGVGLALSESDTATELGVFIDLDSAIYERTLGQNGKIGSFVAGRQVTGLVSRARGAQFDETIWTATDRKHFFGEDVARAGLGYVILGNIGILGQQIYEGGGFETTKSFPGETSIPPELQG